MASKIKRGDEVLVIAGRDKGRRGEVLRVLPDENRAFVRGINMVKRHQKQTPQSEGGIVSKEASIHMSNLAMVDPKEQSASRVGFKIQDDGSKVRVAKKSGEVIDG